MSTHRCLAPVLLVLSLVLSACAPASPAARLQGRWHRLDAALPGFVADPLGSLAQSDIEVRDQGLLVGLLLNSGQAFTTLSGGYALVDAEHIQIDGKCWQGYDSHPCSQTYRFSLSGDHLILFGDGQVVAGAVANGQLDYQRSGPVAAALPPTLVPPMPSATP
jgi:hypothetical protein